MTTNENGNYTGKVAFVTGAANGIGRATALAFAREGANVVVADISEQGNQETTRMIEELGGRALAVKCDVTRDEDVKAALDKAVEAFGRLDVAFNNAGSEQAITAMADLTEEEWDRIVGINLRSVFLCMKYEIPLMLNQGAPKLAELTDDVLYGDVWERPQLSKRDRSLVTVAALIAMNRPDQLRSHLVRACENGVTQEELIETITHLAFYAGWPNAVTAISVAKEVFENK